VHRLQVGGAENSQITLLKLLLLSRAFSACRVGHLMGFALRPILERAFRLSQPVSVQALAATNASADRSALGEPNSLDHILTGSHNRPMEYVTAALLESGLDEIRQSPTNDGRVELIVRRPAENEREVVLGGTLDCSEGLIGDKWAHGSSHPDTQLTLMNSRVALLVAGQAERRQLAGDQLYVDFDLSEHNLPPGTRLQVGSAIIEATSPPHLGCKKFAERFGPHARRFVNSPIGRELRLRGLNAKIIIPGSVQIGDTIRKLSV
jgi:MOSC domain-containing protein YiiM